jgi:PAS domain S-box-containing protein
MDGKAGDTMQELTDAHSRIGEERIREAFLYAASGMAITDLDGRFQETNSAYREIVGRDEAELDRESILSITHKDDRENCRTLLSRLVSGETASFVLEKRYVRPDGSAAWVRNSFSLLKDQVGHPSHIILVCNDITERLQVERVLAQGEKLAVMGRLAALIAHEINTPLESVINLLYLVRTADSLGTARQLAERAEEEVQRAADIAKNTLQFNQEQAKPKLTDLAELLDSVLALFRRKLLDSGIDVHLEKDSGVELLCYAGEIRQVMANLIRNAIEAMPNGGRLRMRLRRSSGLRSGKSGIRFTLADTGCGIGADTRKHIYDPFFTTKEKNGTGLGLWVTARILAKHGAAVRLRSKDETGASGTVFMLIFPCDELTRQISDT